MSRERELILAVDDNQVSRLLMQRTLQRHQLLADRPLDVILANNGEHAQKLFDLERPDLVILDLVMPKLDGFELVRRIRNTPHGKDVPLIATSALWKQPEIREQLNEDFGVEFVEKPIVGDELVELVIKMLDGAQ